MLALSAALVAVALAMLALRWTTGWGGQVLVAVAVALAGCSLVVLRVAQRHSRQARRLDDRLLPKS
jgi:predicted phage tail protein